MEELFMQIAQLGPVVGILAYFIWYFKGEIAAKNLEIKELNQALRDSQKETLLAINKLTDVISDLKTLIQERIK